MKCSYNIGDKSSSRLGQSIRRVSRVDSIKGRRIDGHGRRIRLVHRHDKLREYKDERVFLGPGSVKTGVD
jgi:hypothetical protein